jgi:hypothetical protein
MIRLAMLSPVVLLLLPAFAAANDYQRLRPWPLKPVRLDVPIREDNISDEEVREVRDVMADVYPGAIVNIGTVVDRCPCEDGPACTSQVWVIAYGDGKSNGLMLSRIDYEWQLGPLQAWWIEFDELRARMASRPRDQGQEGFAYYLQLLEAHEEMLGRAPRCARDEKAAHRAE